MKYTDEVIRHLRAHLDDEPKKDALTGVTVCYAVAVSAMMEVRDMAQEVAEAIDDHGKALALLRDEVAALVRNIESRR